MPNPLIIFEFIDYRKFVVNRLKNLPKRGHGQFRRISEHLGMHTTELRVDARELRALGWKVWVVWECQTKDSMQLNRLLNRMMKWKG